MRIAYARVSTDKQELDRQLDLLDREGYDKLITEKFTGTKKDREGLRQLMDTVREGDVVMVESISRLGRKTLDILQIVEDLGKMGVHFISLKEKFDTSTPTGEAMFRMMAVIAQLERDLTVQRVTEGLQSAKARGKHIGRPKVDTSKVSKALRLYDEGWTIKDIVETVGIGQGTLYRAINKRKAQEIIDKGIK